MIVCLRALLLIDYYQTFYSFCKITIYIRRILGVMKCNKYLLIFMPGLKWLSNYTIRDAVADLIAGITVGLTVLPQSLAYAALAGLPPQVMFKLYTSLGF